MAGVPEESVLKFFDFFCFYDLYQKVEILFKFMFEFMFRFMLAIPQKRKREEMLLLILSNTPISKHYNLCLNVPVNKFSQNFYVKIYVIKHDMDPNSNINYHRKIGPLCHDEC